MDWGWGGVKVKLSSFFIHARAEPLCRGMGWDGSTAVALAPHEQQQKQQQTRRQQRRRNQEPTRTDLTLSHSVCLCPHLLRSRCARPPPAPRPSRGVAAAPGLPRRTPGGSLNQTRPLLLLPPSGAPSGRSRRNLARRGRLQPAGTDGDGDGRPFRSAVPKVEGGMHRSPKVYVG